MLRESKQLGPRQLEDNGAAQHQAPGVTGELGTDTGGARRPVDLEVGGTAAVRTTPRGQQGGAAQAIDRLTEGEGEHDERGAADDTE